MTGSTRRTTHRMWWGCRWVARCAAWVRESLLREAAKVLIEKEAMSGDDLADLADRYGVALRSAR